MNNVYGRSYKHCSVPGSSCALRRLYQPRKGPGPCQALIRTEHSFTSSKEDEKRNGKLDQAAAILKLSRREALISACASALGATLLKPSPVPAAGVIDEDVAMQVFTDALPSVAAIAVVKSSTSGLEVPEGSGSGVVWDSYGHIVTNYHCVSRVDKSDPRAIRVTLGLPSTSGTSGDSEGPNTYFARIIGLDAMHDLAVLQLTSLTSLEGGGGATASSAAAPGGPMAVGGVSSGGERATVSGRSDFAGVTQPIKVAGAGDLRVGQSVYAIGNAYGLGPSLSAGVVSGLNRSIPSPVGTIIFGAVQTDANINAGNSGGPLLDSSGRLVGLCTATFTRSGTGRGSGVNFALPTAMLREIVPNLILYGNPAGKRV